MEKQYRIVPKYPDDYRVQSCIPRRLFGFTLHRWRVEGYRFSGMADGFKAHSFETVEEAKSWIDSDIIHIRDVKKHLAQDPIDYP